MNGLTKCSIYIQWNFISALKRNETDTHYNMGKLWRHYAKRNKPDINIGWFLSYDIVSV